MIHVIFFVQKMFPVTYIVSVAPCIHSRGFVVFKVVVIVAM